MKTTTHRSHRPHGHYRPYLPYRRHQGHWMRNRAESKPRPAQRSSPKKSLPTAVIRKNAQGRYEIRLPAQVSAALKYKPGRRIWFAVVGQGARLTRKPWGPRPETGRHSSRLKRTSKP